MIQNRGKEETDLAIKAALSCIIYFELKIRKRDNQIMKRTVPPHLKFAMKTAHEQNDVQKHVFRKETLITGEVKYPLLLDLPPSPLGERSRHWLNFLLLLIDND